jgi:hypothetical protein
LVDFIGETEGDGLPGDRFLDVAIEGHDASHLRSLSGRQDAHGIALLHGTRADQPGEAAEIQIGPGHPLHGHPEWPSLITCRIHLNGGQMVEDGDLFEYSQ